MQRRHFLLGSVLSASAAGYFWHRRHPLPAWEAWTPVDGVRNRGGGLNYAISDRKLMDYQIYEREGFWLRGPNPAPLERRGYIAFAGAAQTFGRFTPNPFATRVGDALDAKILNLGIAGAGPSNFLNSPELLDWINASRFLVLQVMAGRSAGNSLMQTVQGRTVLYKGNRTTAEAAWDDVIRDPSVSAKRFWDLIVETRADWVSSYARLLDAVKVPVVLLFFGKSPPRKDETPQEKPRTLAELMGDHPQLVSREMLAEISARCESYVEVVTRKGSPQKLPIAVDIFGTGKRKAPPENFGRTNGYYPSPEMHAIAAEALIPPCRALWESAA